MKYIDTAGIAFTYGGSQIDYFLAEILPCKETFKNEYFVKDALIDGSDEYQLPEYESDFDLTYVAESRSGYHNEDEIPENLSPHELPSVAALIDKKTLLPNLYYQQGRIIFFHNRIYRAIFEIDIFKLIMPSNYRFSPTFVWRPKVIVFYNMEDHQENVTNYIRARYQQILEAEVVRIDNLLRVSNVDELIRKKMSLNMMIKRAQVFKLEDWKFQPKPIYVGNHYY